MWNKSVAPIIRGVLEILLSIWLIYDWVNIPTWVIWLVGIGTFIQGISSILEGYINQLR